MSGWIPLDSEAALEAFMAAIDGFHDSCLREASLVTETFVDQDGAMETPGHLDTSALLFFQSQAAGGRAIELQCDGVSLFRMTPTAENRDSIITACDFSGGPGGIRLGLYFVGLPLEGPPAGVLHRRISDDEPPALEVVAARMAWRPLAFALGPVVRHRRADG